MNRLELLRLKPVFQPRVWGGRRLNPGADEPIGEAWIVYEGNLVDGGAWSGQTLSDVARQLGALLLGDPVVERTGSRFPLLIKLLDSQEWLSVQVHPNDEQAAQLEGDGVFGKTEAWHVLEADRGARVVFGLNDEPSTAALREMADTGSFDDALHYVAVSAGDTLFTPAGTVHSIGPGLFIYEVQQTSDITYRLYDWNRPMTDGRALHLDKGLAVISQTSDELHPRHPSGVHCQRDVAVKCGYFVLETLSLSNESTTISTGSTSFHALTVAEGSARVATADSSTVLNVLETVLVPAAMNEYTISSETPCKILLSYVPVETGT